jgi:hypothetical protein
LYHQPTKIVVETGVLPLEMVDNVISPCERTSGRFSPHSTLQGGYFILYAHAPVPAFTFISRLQPFHNASSHLIHAHIVKYGTGGREQQSTSRTIHLRLVLPAAILAHFHPLLWLAEALRFNTLICSAKPLAYMAVFKCFNRR